MFMYTKHIRLIAILENNDIKYVVVAAKFFPKSFNYLPNFVADDDHKILLNRIQSHDKIID